MEAIQKFEIGDRVVAVAYIDCFGAIQKEISGLTITDVKLVRDVATIAERYRMADYYRYTARDNGWKMVEGAARFFRKEA